MKKILIILLSIAFVPKIYGWEFKFIAGANLSKHKIAIEHAIQGDGLYRWKWKTGFLLGGGTEFNLSEKISIEIDGLYFQKRSAQKHWDWETQGYKISVYALHEISFPVLVKLKHLFNSSFYLFGGGEFAYIISGTENGRFDYGAVFGGGIEVKKVIPISFVAIRCHIGYKADAIALVLGF